MRTLLFSTLVLAAAASTAAAQSCRQTVGPQRARVLVQQCMKVTQATHPPCNAANPCDDITGEIEHGCAELAESRNSVRPPAFCGRYR